MLSDNQRAFLDENHAAALISINPDGTPHAVRVGVAMVDGRLWSSGTADRVRTGHLRRDPRATVLVWESGFGYLTIEGRVEILDGPEVPDQSYELFRVMQGKEPGERLMWHGGEKNPDEFRQAMIDERRVIFELTPERTYGVE